MSPPSSAAVESSSEVLDRLVLSELNAIRPPGSRWGGWISRSMLRDFVPSHRSAAIGESLARLEARGLVEVDRAGRSELWRRKG
jgi:hypothetical protein